MGRQAMKVVMVVREGRLAGTKSDRVWKGDKWVRYMRVYTAKNVQSALKSFCLKKKKMKKCQCGERIYLSPKQWIF